MWLILAFGVFALSSIEGRVTDYVSGPLVVNVVKATNLKNTDEPFSTADPFVKVTAYGFTTVSFPPVLGRSFPDIRVPISPLKETAVKSETLNPVWSTDLSFGHGDWTHFEIQVWDSDPALNPDDEMTVKHRVEILTSCSDPITRSNTETKETCGGRFLPHCSTTTYNEQIFFSYRMDYQY